jgi:hypothetical protein
MMATADVDHETARGTRVVYGLLGDSRFAADAAYARSLKPLADLDAGAIIDLLYKVGLNRISPGRAVFSCQRVGELAWEAHVALTQGLKVFEDWPNAFFGVLDDIRRCYPATKSASLNRSAGVVERWLDRLTGGTGGAIRSAVAEYRRRVRDDAIA